MKQSIQYFLILLFVFIKPDKVDAQDTLAEDRLDFLDIEGNYTGDLVCNFTGGISKGITYLGLINVKLAVDLDNAVHLKGGALFVNMANSHGGMPSAEFIGDYQVASNIEAGNHTFFQELWYRQVVGPVEMIIGLQDLGREFVSGNSPGLFINSSFGTHSTISTNLPAPVFPVTSLGIQLHLHLSGKFTTKFAVFDGFPDSFENNPYNTTWKLNKNEGYLSFIETSYLNETAQLPGNYKLGYYYHNHCVSAYIPSGIQEDSIKLENHGIYLMAEQSVFHRPEKDITTFIQAGWSTSAIIENDYYLGFGVNFTGLMPGRNDDMAGIALAHAGLNRGNGDETTIEITYQMKLSERVFIQPDLQYIINPVGSPYRLPDALAGIIRFGICW